MVVVNKIIPWTKGPKVTIDRLNTLNSALNDGIDTSANEVEQVLPEDALADFIFKATADEANNEITARRVDSDGVASGETFTFKVLPE